MTELERVQLFEAAGLDRMLQQPKIHPLLAFQHSGLFVDPERAYTLSMKYYEEQQEKLAQQQKTAQNNTDGSGNPNGSDEDE